MITHRQIEEFCFLCLWFFFLHPLISAQPSDHAISIEGSLVADSKIFLYPKSNDQLQRAAVLSFPSAPALSLSYRYQLSPSTLLQSRAEYLSWSENTSDAFGTVTDNGFTALAFESSLLFQLPVSSRTIRFCIGGGGGVYAASRKYSIAGIAAESRRFYPTLDIHIIFFTEVFFTRNISLHCQFLFRDPQISVENAFSVDNVTSNGVEYSLQMTPFISAVNLNGNVYVLGISFYL